MHYQEAKECRASVQEKKKRRKEGREKRQQTKQAVCFMSLNKIYD
jgi:hypothetical protein